MRLDNLPVTCNYLVKKVKQIMFAEAQVPRLRSEVNWRGFRPVSTWWLDLSNHQPDTRLWLFLTFTPGWLVGWWVGRVWPLDADLCFPRLSCHPWRGARRCLQLCRAVLWNTRHNTAGMLSGQPSAPGHRRKPRWQADKSATRANVSGLGRLS